MRKTGSYLTHKDEDFVYIIYKKYNYGTYHSLQSIDIHLVISDLLFTQSQEVVNCVRGEQYHPSRLNKMRDAFYPVNHMSQEFKRVMKMI